MPQDAETVQEYLEEDGVNKVILLAGSNAEYNTLTIDSQMEIPGGKTLTLADGVNAELREGSALIIDGAMTGGGNNTLTVSNGGALMVNGSGTLEMRSILNYGFLMNLEEGRIVTDSLTTNGYFGSAGAIEGTLIHTGGDTKITGGTISNPVSGAALAAQGGGTIGINDGTIDGGALPALLVSDASVEICIGNYYDWPNTAVLRSGLQGQVVRLDADGAGLDYIVPPETSSKGSILTVAPTGEDGFVDGLAETAAFSAPPGHRGGGDGTIYVSDTSNGAVRRFQNGVVTTLARRDAGDLNSFIPSSPVGLAVHGGELYVCDSFARRIFVISGAG